MITSIQALFSILVSVFGLVGFLKPGLFAKIFRPRGLLTNDPLQIKTFEQVHGKEKGAMWGKVTGLIFIILGIIGFMHYGLGLF